MRKEDIPGLVDALKAFAYAFDIDEGDWWRPLRDKKLVEPFVRFHSYYKGLVLKRAAEACPGAPVFVCGKEPVPQSCATTVQEFRRRLSKEMHAPLQNPGITCAEFREQCGLPPDPFIDGHAEVLEAVRRRSDI